MSVKQSSTEIDAFNAPWNKELTVAEVQYEGGFKMFHLRIKEGKRFTDLELDPETATHLAELMSTWAKANATD